ncbi:hypothetical protein BHE74_00059188 [Ensete ventricosum]|nr:hypothetical protein BHE74_00059188 [Ensete ventricosum]
MRPRSAAPIPGDGDREVVREQGSPNKCVQESAQEQQRHHDRGHERQAQREALAEGARNLLRVPDGGDGSRRHRELEEEGDEVEGPGHGVELPVDGFPRDARRRRRRDEQGVHRVQLLGQGLAGRQPLVKGHEHAEIVRQPHRPQELAGLLPPDPGRQDRPDEVAHHRKVGRRVGHLGQPALPSRQPLPVDLELEDEDGRDAGAPGGGVEQLGRNPWRGADGQEHAGDPRREEEVHSDGVEVLAADGLEVEDAFKCVGDGNGCEDGERDEPQGEVDVGGHVEERHGRARRQGSPQDGLAPEAETHTEAPDRKAEEERPHLVLRQEYVFVVLREIQLDDI